MAVRGTAGRAPRENEVQRELSVRSMNQREKVREGREGREGELDEAQPGGLRKRREDDGEEATRETGDEMSNMK